MEGSLKRSSVLSCLARLTVLILLNSLGIPWASAAPVQGPPATAGSKPTTTTVIVKAAKGLQLAQQLAAINGHGGVVKRSIPKLNLHVVEIPAAAAAAITKELSSDPAIARVEANRQRKIKGLPALAPAPAPQTSAASLPWYLSQISWDQVYGSVTPTSLATVAVLDTGVDASHPDLTDNVVPGTSILDGSDGTTDPNGHGTWVSGLVAARLNQAQGTGGVGYSLVQVMPVTVLGADGTGYDGDIIAGVVYAADHGASVILMAFSASCYSDSLQEAIDYAWSNNVVIVAAAGNDGSNTGTFPAGNRGVIGVSATDQNDALASWSNYGPSIFMAAPGVGIASTYPGASYVTWDGTSASAAIVAGSAALMRAADSTLSNGVVVDRLASTADAAGTQNQTGNGRVNLARAIASTATNSIQPAGSPPVGNGGPFVGPYTIANVTYNSIVSQNSTTCTTNTDTFNVGDTACAKLSLTFSGGTTKATYRIQWYKSTTVSAANLVYDKLFQDDTNTTETDVETVTR